MEADRSIPYILCDHRVNRRYCVTCADPYERLNGCIICGRETTTRIQTLIDDQHNTYMRTPGWLLCSIECSLVLKEQKDKTLRAKRRKTTGSNAYSLPA